MFYFFTDPSTYTPSRSSSIKKQFQLGTETVGTETVGTGTVFQFQVQFQAGTGTEKQ